MWLSKFDAKENAFWKGVITKNIEFWKGDGGLEVFHFPMGRATEKNLEGVGCVQWEHIIQDE